MLNRRVVIVDDDHFLRSLMQKYLVDSQFDVVAAATSQQALKAIKDHDPDALVLDIDLGEEITGLDIAHRVRPAEKGIAIVFLTSLSDLRFANTNVERDFPKAAYLNKHLLTDPQMLVDALETVLNDKDVSAFRHDRDPKRPLGELTKLQIKVLQMLAAGKTNKQISVERGTTIEATEALISRIWKVLGIEASEAQNARVLAAKKYFENANIFEVEK